MAFAFGNSQGKCISKHANIHNAYFLKSCGKSYYNGTVSYLKHMGRDRILAGSNSGGFSIGRWRTRSAIQSGEQAWQAIVAAAPTALSQQVLLWYKNSLWGFQHNTRCKMTGKIETHSLSGIHTFPSTQATKPSADKHGSELAAS